MTISFEWYTTDHTLKGAPRKDGTRKTILHTTYTGLVCRNALHPRPQPNWLTEGEALEVLDWCYSNLGQPRAIRGKWRYEMVGMTTHEIVLKAGKFVERASHRKAMESLHITIMNEADALMFKMALLDN